MLQTPYYVFYADEFIENYNELNRAFKSIYPNYQLDYSFKTNYTPDVCKIIRDLGGYAEVVSDMEYELAIKIGFAPDRILYNGSGKGSMLENCLLSGGHLNIDNRIDIERTIPVARENRHNFFKVAVRVNFDIDKGLHSRFGLDVENSDFQKAIEQLNSEPNINVTGIHFHISRAKGLNAWEKRINKTIEIIDSFFAYHLEHIGLGNGMFGKLDNSLQQQFGTTPTYEDYAGVVMKIMADHYAKRKDKPILFTEPGTTVVFKYFHLFTRVLNITEIRGKYFALLDCSFQNVGEICGLKKVPFIIRRGQDSPSHYYDSIDLVGYT